MDLIDTTSMDPIIFTAALRQRERIRSSTELGNSEPSLIDATNTNSGGKETPVHRCFDVASANRQAQWSDCSIQQQLTIIGWTSPSSEAASNDVG